jgi:putative endonuclease
LPREHPEKRFYVYVLAKARNSTLYVGVTSDLPKRITEHKVGSIEGFTSKYGVKKLVYFEVFDDPENAIKREKRLKKWNRAWKMRIIEEMNPEWKDLFERIVK